MSSFLVSRPVDSAPHSGAFAPVWALTGGSLRISITIIGRIYKFFALLYIYKFVFICGYRISCLDMFSWFFFLF